MNIYTTLYTALIIAVQAGEITNEQANLARKWLVLQENMDLLKP
jgi:hypothetical protein